MPISPGRDAYPDGGDANVECIIATALTSAFSRSAYRLPLVQSASASPLSHDYDNDDDNNSGYDYIVRL